MLTKRLTCVCLNVCVCVCKFCVFSLGQLVVLMIMDHKMIKWYQKRWWWEEYQCSKIMNNLPVWKLHWFEWWVSALKWKVFLSNMRVQVSPLSKFFDIHDHMRCSFFFFNLMLFSYVLCLHQRETSQDTVNWRKSQLNFFLQLFHLCNTWYWPWSFRMWLLCFGLQFVCYALLQEKINMDLVILRIVECKIGWISVCDAVRLFVIVKVTANRI